MIIDYAHPCMMAENALKEAHIDMLNNEHDEAIEQCFKAVAEVKLMINAINHMKEMRDNQNALRQQAPTL
jgi:hypothetical protein